MSLNSVPSLACPCVKCMELLLETIQITPNLVSCSESVPSTTSLFNFITASSFGVQRKFC